MKTRFITFLLLFVMNLGVFAQSSYQPTEENLKARQEFQDNKFGIFLHWGLYAMLATGEWTMTEKYQTYCPEIPAVLSDSLRQADKETVQMLPSS